MTFMRSCGSPSYGGFNGPHRWTRKYRRHGGLRLFMGGSCRQAFRIALSSASALPMPPRDVAPANRHQTSRALTCPPPCPQRFPVASCIPSPFQDIACAHACKTHRSVACRAFLIQDWLLRPRRLLLAYAFTTAADTYTAARSTLIVRRGNKDGRTTSLLGTALCNRRPLDGNAIT